MEPEEIEAYVDAVMVEFMPVLRAAVDTWARLDLVAPAPRELVELLIEAVFGPSPSAYREGE